MPKEISLNQALVPEPRSGMAEAHPLSTLGLLAATSHHSPLTVSSSQIEITNVRPTTSLARPDANHSLFPFSVPIYLPDLHPLHGETHHCACPTQKSTMPMPRTGISPPSNLTLRFLGPYDSPRLRQPSTRTKHAQNQLQKRLFPRCER